MVVDAIKVSGREVGCGERGGVESIGFIWHPVALGPPFKFEGFCVFIKTTKAHYVEIDPKNSPRAQKRTRENCTLC